jgi:di/tricarboxylate transporter
VVAATRKVLTEILAGDLGLVPPEQASGDAPSEVGRRQRTQENFEYSRGESSQVVAEVMVAPASRPQGQTLRMVGFHHQTRCIVLGIQRRSRMIRARMTDIRLEAGDVLLVQGRAADVHALKVSRDVVLMEWSTEELPALTHTRSAAAVFVVTIALAASGLVPLVIAALGGATVMVASGMLSPRQAARAIDTRIITTIGTALALGVAMQETGGAVYIARALVETLMAAGPTAVLSVFFLLAAVLTNIISNNAVAVLFTPIAVDTALQLGVAPQAFAVAVVFGANCSFASPIGYQTNLLVMGPGNYRFLDFARAGVPLIFLLWIVFTLFVPWWYGF